MATPVVEPKFTRLTTGALPGAEGPVFTVVRVFVAGLLMRMSCFGWGPTQCGFEPLCGCLCAGREAASSTPWHQSGRWRGRVQAKCARLTPRVATLQRLHRQLLTVLAASQLDVSVIDPTTCGLQYGISKWCSVAMC